MKNYLLLSLLVIFTISGCNSVQQPEVSNKMAPTYKSQSHSEETISFRIHSFEILKKGSMQWNDVFSDWDPKSVVKITDINPESVISVFSKKAKISDYFTATQFTSDRMPVPYSSIQSKQDLVLIQGKHQRSPSVRMIDMVFTPTILRSSGILNLEVYMSFQDHDHNLSMSQKVALITGQSALFAFAINENCLQVVIVSPTISN